MPKGPDEASGRGATSDLPRTDLPPKKLPYDEDYFGSGEEEGVVKERQASEEESGRAPGGKPPRDPG